MPDEQPIESSEPDQVYYDLEIEANAPDTDIWLGDDEGHLVQKEVGSLRSSLMPGDYTVEFSLGSPCYPIHLYADARFTQDELEAGPTCERPVPQIEREEDP